MLAVALVVAAGCATTTASTPSAHRATSSGQPAVHGTPKLSARLIVPSPSIMSGSSTKARLVIDNRTGHAIPVSDCEAYQVLLESPAYRPVPVWPLCLTRVSIPQGVSTREVPVAASASSCGAHAAPPGLMACAAAGELPALPPGTYTAHVFAAAPALPTAPDVTVRVLPSRGGPKTTIVRDGEVWLQGEITQDGCDMAKNRLPIGDVGCSIRVNGYTVVVVHGNARLPGAPGTVTGLDVSTDQSGSHADVYARITGPHEASILSAPKYYARISR